MSPNGTRVEASPTKDFFIHMLTRDIELIPAVGDLVDNCVDGAIRLRPDGNFEGLVVRLTAKADGFLIEDNCGGIPRDIARQYAFRFGRPEEMEETPHSIGQFGVGMKRALFKLGEAFEVLSTANGETFSVTVEVDDWRHDPDWVFTLSPQEDDAALDEDGTKITVSPLHQSVASQFSSDTFIKRLATTIGAQHQQSIGQGLLITLNTRPIGSRDLELLRASDLKPAVESVKMYEDSESPITIRLYVGLSPESNPQEAGWFVYCNGRLVVGADKTEATGWGGDGELQFPRFHNRYARLRGYVFFDCDDASRLPWTTTKTGIERESPVYQRALQRMVELARPVAAFLRRLESEIEEPPEPGTELAPLVTRATATSIADLASEQSFHFSRPKSAPRPKGEPTQSIQYRRPITKIERAKTALGASSASEVGQRTFDYFYKRECGE